MFGKVRSALPLVSAASLVALFAACGDTTGSGAALLTVRLTDAPAPVFETAIVDIGRIEFLSADGPSITLTENGGTHDLLTLQNGATAGLATLEIEPGRYTQIRLVVNAARVTLADGATFPDGSAEKDLIMPSAAQTGIKVNLKSGSDDEGPGVSIVPGETILVIDFDVSQNFVILGGADTPSGIQEVLFTPLLRAVLTDVAGSISGTITSANGASVDGLTVRAERTDAEGSGTTENETSTATTVTNADGTYTLRFLAPGTYSVSVDETTTTPAARDVVVEAGADVTPVDFAIGS
jgi:hypothetical protein